MERNPRLVGIGGHLEGSTYALADDEIGIGRDPSNTLAIDDSSVSRHHCAIRKIADDEFEIHDLGSRNGTVVNGIPISQRVLADHDEIRIGRCHFIFLTSNFDADSDSNPFQLDEDTADTRALSQVSVAAPSLQELAGLQLSGSLGVLVRIAASIHGAGTMDQLSARVLEAVFEAIPAERAAIILFDENRDEPVFTYSRQRDGSTSTTVRASAQVVERARQEGLPVQASGAHVDQFRRMLAAPLMSNGKCAGVLYLESNAAGEVFTDGHLQLASAVAGQLAAPLENLRRRESLERENQRLREAVNVDSDMVGAGPRMREIFQLVGKVAPTDSTVLIRGESGTGKELIARAIHRNSPRAKQPFVAINCSAVTETLVESEIFGHEKGAFTGATMQKKGKLELADHGTLFLDEVGELPMAFQTKLLRVLQEREFEHVGGTRTIRVDVRLIAATNRDLENAIAAGSFREDLYYRLNVVCIKTPPLRDRREDLPVLARHFAEKHGNRTKRKVVGLSREAMECLEAYDWPGNVRELENAIERAVVLGSTDLILPEDLPEAVLETSEAGSSLPGRFYQTVKEEKKRSILAALEQTQGNYTEAAKSLGLHPNYLHRLVRNLNLKSEIKKVRG